jgi:hypothetical protein
VNGPGPSHLTPLAGVTELDPLSVTPVPVASTGANTLSPVLPDASAIYPLGAALGVILLMFFMATVIRARRE